MKISKINSHIFSYLPKFLLLSLMAPLAMAQPLAPQASEEVPDAMTFMQNLGNCNELTDKAIVYKTSGTAGLVIFSSPPIFCVVESVDSANPAKNKVCVFTKDQIGAMVTPQAFAIMTEFSQKHDNPDQVKALFKPITSCMSVYSAPAAAPAQAAPAQPKPVPPSSVPAPQQNYNYSKMIH